MSYLKKFKPPWMASESEEEEEEDEGEVLIPPRIGRSNDEGERKRSESPSKRPTSKIGNIKSTTSEEPKADRKVSVVKVEKPPEMSSSKSESKKPEKSPAALPVQTKKKPFKAPWEVGYFE